MSGASESEFQFLPKGWNFALAFIVTLSGGLILAAGVLVELPAAWLIAGVGALLVGATIILILASRESRRTSAGFFRSLGQGLRSAGGWLLAWIP